MRKSLLMSVLLFLLGAVAVAQTSLSTQTPAAAPAAQISQGGVSSQGPVVLDYRGVATTSGSPVETQIAKAVRHQLLMLPYYSLFDDLQYSVQGRTVTLNGYVTSVHAVTRSDAENVVKHIEGVDKVVNNIKILPPSPLDEQVRAQVFRSLNRTGSLSRYFWPASPAIHIIVDNQRVTLDGFVNSETDKNLATIAANSVPGVFQMKNELKVVK